MISPFGNRTYKQRTDTSQTGKVSTSINCVRTASPCSGGSFSCTCVMCEVSNQAFVSYQTSLFTGSGDAMFSSVPDPVSCFVQYELTQETIRGNELN